MSEAPAEETEGEFAGYDPGDEGDPEQLEGFYGAPVAAGSTPLEQLLEDLNPDQRRAVEHGEGPLLVLAGAGSGKTRVLVHRIAYLLQTGMARPGQILAITFTNKAANEMKARVEALTGNAARVMWVMTFHSACARILRQHAERLGYKRGFSIFDEADSRRMVKRCMDELDVDPKRYPPRTIKGAISGAKNRLRDAETLPRGGGLVLRVDRRRRLRDVREADARQQRDGLRRPARPHGQPARALCRCPRRLTSASSATSSSTSTRTPTGSSTGSCSC